MRFEWDEKKNRSNVENHNVSFELAPELFNGSVLERIDHRHDEEVRFIATGMVQERVLVCVYTDRGNVRRIISLRKATRNEQETYYSDVY